MGVHVEDVMRGLKHAEIKDKSICSSWMGERSDEVVAVKYAFDIVEMGGVRHETVTANVKANHKLEPDEKIFSYPVEDINEGVTLCKALCEKLGLGFTEELEKFLRKESKNKNQYSLYVIERAIYKR